MYFWNRFKANILSLAFIIDWRVVLTLLTLWKLEKNISKETEELKDSACYCICIVL